MAAVAVPEVAAEVAVVLASAAAEEVVVAAVLASVAAEVGVVPASAAAVVEQPVCLRLVFRPLAVA